MLPSLSSFKIIGFIISPHYPIVSVFYNEAVYNPELQPNGQQRIRTDPPQVSKTPPVDVQHRIVMCICPANPITPGATPYCSMVNLGRGRGAGSFRAKSRVGWTRYPCGPPWYACLLIIADYSAGSSSGSGSGTTGKAPSESRRICRPLAISKVKVVIARLELP